MSYIYSQALVAAFSEASCLDTAAFAPSSENPTLKPSWYHDKTMEPSRHSRFGMTYAPLTESLGADLLMWFAEDSLAKTSALQEGGPDWTAKGQGYGQKWLGLLAKYDPNTHSLKTAQLSLLEDSTGCCPTLPRWGLMLDGELYQQPMLEPCTAENASGFLLPTPCATDAGSGRFNTSKGSDKKRPMLALMARKNLWPTPTTQGMNGGSNSRNSAKNRGMWPIPTVCGNYNKPGASATSGMGLATAVKLWPTPTASASKGSSQSSLTRKDGRSRVGDRLDHAVMASDAGQLNPNWVEWLMGWPIGQTALKPLETDKFHEWQRQHSPCCLDDREDA